MNTQQSARKSFRVYASSLALAAFSATCLLSTSYVASAQYQQSKPSPYQYKKAPSSTPEKTVNRRADPRRESIQSRQSRPRSVASAICGDGFKVTNEQTRSNDGGKTVDGRIYTCTKTLPVTVMKCADMGPETWSQGLKLSQQKGPVFSPAPPNLSKSSTVTIEYSCGNFYN